MGMNRGALNERIPHQGLWSPGEDGWMGTQAEDGPAFLANIREAKGRHTSRIWWLDFRYFPFKCPFLFNVLIGVWLLYTVLLVSAVQRSESAIIVVVFSCSVVSSFLQTHGAQPARLLCPGHFPGKNTGVGCHFLLSVSSWPRDRTHVFCIGRWILYHRATWGVYR